MLLLQDRSDEYIPGVAVAARTIDRSIGRPFVDLNDYLIAPLATGSFNARDLFGSAGLINRQPR